MIKKVDINCDMGELMPGIIENIDEAFMPFISSCNISCGVHSGNPIIIKKTIVAALANQVSIGAHPSYPDRANSGRKSMDISTADLQTHLEHQLYGLNGLVQSTGGNIYHVKAHGALYNDIAYHEEKAKTFVQTVKSINPCWIIYGLANSPLKKICEANKMEFVSEVFADRTYESNLQLRSRKLGDAVLHNLEAVELQLGNFIHNKVESYQNTILDINTESICIHSDSPGALKIAEKVYHFIKERNIEIGKAER